jgi:hypothetical protein
MQHLNVAIKYIEHSGKGTGGDRRKWLEKYTLKPTKDIFWSAEVVRMWKFKLN